MNKHNMSSLYLAVCALCTIAIVWIFGFNAHGLLHIDLFRFQGRVRLENLVYLGLYVAVVIFLLLAFTVSSKLYYLHERQRSNGNSGGFRYHVIHALWVIVGLHIFARLFIGLAILRDIYFMTYM